MVKRIKNVLAGVSALALSMTSISSIVSNATGEWLDNGYLKDKNVAYVGWIYGTTCDDYGLLDDGVVRCNDYISQEVGYFTDDNKSLVIDIAASLDYWCLTNNSIFVLDEFNEDMSLKEFARTNPILSVDFNEEANSKLPEDAVLLGSTLYVLRDALDSIKFKTYYGVPENIYNLSFDTEGDLYKEYYADDGTPFNSTIKDAEEIKTNLAANGNYASYFHNDSNIKPYFNTSNAKLLEQQITTYNNAFVFNNKYYSIPVVKNIDNRFIDSFDLVISEETDVVSGDTYSMVGAVTTVSLGTLLKRAAETYAPEKYKFIASEDWYAYLPYSDEPVEQEQYSVIGTGDYYHFNTSFDEDTPSITLQFDVNTNDASIMYLNGTKPCVGVLNGESIIKEPTTELILKGDATGDGRVDIIDVITVNKAVLGKEHLSEQAVKNVDTNENGIPDSVDSLTIMKYIVGLVDSID